jgi:hypothetical protein
VDVKMLAPWKWAVERKTLLDKRFFFVRKWE